MAHVASIYTKTKKHVLDITEQVESYLQDMGAGDGLCHVFAKHTTCAITTADLDPGTDLDMLDVFEKIIPKLNFRHPHNPSHAPRSHYVVHYRARSFASGSCR